MSSREYFFVQSTTEIGGAETVERERQIRIAIGNGTHPQVYVSLLSLATAIRSVYFLHAIYREPLWRNGVIDVLALVIRCDLVLANSRASMGAISRLRPRVPLKLLYPGVPTPEVAPAVARQRRAELGTGDFAEAAPQVARRLPEARFAPRASEPHFARDRFMRTTL